MTATSARSRPGPRPTSRLGRAAQPLLHRQVLLGPSARQQQREHADHLQDGQRCRRGQVQQDGRLAVISTSRVVFRGPPSSSTTPNEVRLKSKTIETAEMTAGRSSGQVTSRKARHGVAPEQASGFLGTRVQVGPQATHQPDDDRDVVEDVGDHDGRDGAVESRPLGPRRGGRRRWR